LTGESLWVVPSLKPQVLQNIGKISIFYNKEVKCNICILLKFDPITDPLGICGVPPPPGNGTIPVTPGATLKRRTSEDGTVPPAKKFVLAYVCLVLSGY